MIGGKRRPNQACGLLPPGAAQVYEGILNKGGERIVARELTPEEKKRRVVLKRVNMDGSELRSNFIRAGTMARVGGLRWCQGLQK